MALRYAKLRGRIVEKYGSQTAFSEELGVPNNNVSRKLSGNLGFTHSNIVKWCELLDIKPEEIGEYFFCLTS